MRYIKENNIILPHTGKIIFGKITILNPTVEQLINAGYVEYIEPIVEQPQISYEELVEQYIAERYTIKQEIAIIRQKDIKPDEYQIYYDFVEQCKVMAKDDSIKKLNNI